MHQNKSELQVITKAKDLCTYVMTVTQKSPKQYRYTFVGRLQNLTLSIIENFYRAMILTWLREMLLQEKRGSNFRERQ